MRRDLRKILAPRGIPRCFVGHPSMGGIFISESAPGSYRDRVNTSDGVYDALALYRHDLGILCEPGFPGAMVYLQSAC